MHREREGRCRATGKQSPERKGGYAEMGSSPAEQSRGAV